MRLDPEKDIQRLELDGKRYIVIRDTTYQHLLERLEALDTAVDVHRNRAEASRTVLDALVKGRLTPQQVKEVADAPTFGDRLRLLRQYRNLGQEELAEMSGVSQAVISRLENNKTDKASAIAVHKLLSKLEIPEAAMYSIVKVG